MSDLKTMKTMTTGGFALAMVIATANGLFLGAHSAKMECLKDIMHFECGWDIITQ